MGPKMQEQMEVDILLRVQFNSIAPLMELSLPRGARESQVTRPDIIFGSLIPTEASGPKP